MKTVETTCPYCGVGCGVTVTEQSQGAQRDIASVKATNYLIQGSASHPANLGRLCSKGSALGETLELENRLLHAKVRGAQVAPSEAAKAIAEAIQDSIDQYGRDSVAFYLSGQLLTEDYYVANKLMKGYIGTANVDTNSRLCMSSAVVGYKRAFGADTVPTCYEDLEEADLLVLIGSNAAWTHPVLYQRMVAAKEANPNLKVVVIDPRKTVTAGFADLHLAIAPSSDAYLFNGLLNYLIQSQALDQTYIDSFTDGFEEVKRSVADLDIAEVSEKTRCSVDEIGTFFKWFATTPKTISFYSQGINQSSSGSDKCNAIINCHLATGRIGKPGAGPFSITGQPNAMGGREVGGLANQLAAHMHFSPEEIDRVQRFWNSPVISDSEGLKAVDLFEAVADGQIKVLWIMATNPAVSLPNSSRVRAALAQCPTVIVSDVCETDTTQFADIQLPALAWAEKDGTVTNSERTISRQRAFLSAPGDALADWQWVSMVGAAMGFGDSFAYKSARDVFIEHAALSAFENSDEHSGRRDFDIGGLAELSEQQYEQLMPVQWPAPTRSSRGQKRMFSDGRFFTKSSLAHFVTVKPSYGISVTSSARPLMLNTGRIRDQWHTMTRTGRAPSLSRHYPGPSIEVNPADLSARNLNAYDFAQLESDHGRFIGQLIPSDRVKPGELFCPIHWSDQNATQAVVAQLLSSDVDPFSGQPESKFEAVELAPFELENWCRLVSSQRLDCSALEYFSCIKTASGYGYTLGAAASISWIEWLRKQLDQNVHFSEMSALSEHVQKFIGRSEGQIEVLGQTCLNARDLPSFAWLGDAIQSTSVAEAQKLLQGELDGLDATVCSCFQTSRKSIQSVLDNGIADIDGLGAELGCGSKCRSCRPELIEIIEEYQQ